MSQPPPSPAHLRKEYTAGELVESNIAADAIEQFSRWFADAQRPDILEPNAMTLATADAAGKPAGRIVLLKGFDDRGFVFFTNYTSRKGYEIADNPRACLVFFWQALERQVRIDGTVEKISREESVTYFRTRPAASQIGAWVSHQSGVITSRDELEKREAEIKQRFTGGEVPTPDFWGGYRVVPQEIEFWQGRRSRLHDRILYTRSSNGWKIQRLAP
jgi:pyridoxamine 5'-phosphate oxidase